MSSVLFSSAQRIIKQMFDFLQSSGQAKTANFITDSFQTGIVPLEFGEFSVVPGSNNTPTTPTVTIGSGVAYGPDSSRIIVQSGDTTSYNASNPANTTNDGLGNFISTPQSTGVVNVPLIQTSQNYVWIQYLAAIDASAYTLNKETNAKQFYKQIDGYQITVTTTNVAPGPNYLFLANVNMLAGGAVTSSVIFITGRTFFQISENVVPITTAFNNRSNATTVYAENSVLKLEDHIKAIGTGTGQSPTNPHNMSLADLGVSQFDTVAAHRQLEHSNAIIAGVPGTPYPATSAMATSINIVNPGSDTINVFQLLSSEFAIINGTAFNVNAIFGAVPTNATIMFPDSTPGALIYNVYWDSVSKVFAVTTASIAADVTKLWLATVTYTFVGHGVSDHNALSSLIERRRIGSTVEKYQRWKTTARPPVPVNGEFGFNMDLNAPEWFDGTVWQSLTAPTGAVLEFGGASAPLGFLMADGSAVSRTTFANLFTVIGTTFGVGDGSTTFNLPNRINNVGVGAGGSIAPFVGNTTGATTQTPTEVPHQHKENIVADSGVGRGVNDVAEFGTVAESGSRLVGTFAGVSSLTAASIYLTSSVAATINPVSVVQPSIGMNYIIKT